MGKKPQKGNDTAFGQDKSPPDYLESVPGAHRFGFWEGEAVFRAGIARDGQKGNRDREEAKGRG